MQILKQLQIPYSFAKRHGVLLHYVDHQVFIIRKNTTSLLALQEVRRFLGQKAAYKLVEEDEFNQLLSRGFSSDSGESQQVAAGLEDHPDLLSLADQVPQTEDLMDQEDDAPIVRLINALLSEAIRVAASDIHIECFEKKLSVRLRVDGQLREIVQPRRELAPLLVSRIKVMARLDIAEKRIPQDGRISLRLAGREVDVRVSTLPSSYGERVVMRLLDKQAGRLNMTHLGLMPHDYEILTQLVHRPHGIILVTGPTGSGKTTTLYAALSDINDGSKNILTAEDPIEYQLEGIGQTQVNNKVNMTFARALKAMLRQDPDVVMVGEIRDLETAEIAIQASLTGHLVLSTLHTNTAIGAITRLKDMGIEPFLLSSSLIGVVAQRLVRTLCTHCITWVDATDFEQTLFTSIAADVVRQVPQAQGCEQCAQSGFMGRTAIYEIVPIDEKVRRLIHANAAEFELEHYIRQHTGSIREDGLRKVLLGKTTVEEVLRVTNESVELL
ncbi:MULTISPECIES: type II secretion system ATPase GspE [unclassified Acinetobacter]|uniref:type II secretion system ATPase GspE n=1 Tax=unclassified Acinetobacter TaxID=196816 RepID=UPI0029344291|nr:MULTISPECIES: type II secretion system ATPase GspE [unclassified Acinetobacter]WOE30384.1 type II secretion system ATPase GspE [Acinetobacter sp. SAAs470]WOE38575.1 type II secretion system ATPase GspE [Acinetobacter sp. SAAs474]